MMKSMHNQETKALYNAILSLKTTEECEKFFKDICTIKELEALSLRFLVAQQLDKGKNYNDVSRDTGASSATISRVNKCLNYCDGYRIVLDRLKESGDEI
ncbi:MAG: TrpR YerC/YecD [Clostridia bacterium]|nr:TrpR YerC/YecD [Clostridia bacterium]